MPGLPARREQVSDSVFRSASGVPMRRVMPVVAALDICNNILMARPRIPDGRPMSERTIYRRRAAAGLTQPVFRHSFDSSFFAEWSDALAWMTGIIWSDGCLFGNTIEICSKDTQLIELAARLISSDCVMPKNRGAASRLIFTCPNVAKRFRLIGLTECKSLTIAWPEIPTRYEAAFVRGVLDGDGSVQIRKSRPGQQSPDLSVFFYGASELFRDCMLLWLAQNEIRAKHRISHGRVWEISIRHQESLRRLNALIYSAADAPCLLRKRAPFDAWVAAPRAPAGRPKKKDRTAQFPDPDEHGD